MKGLIVIFELTVQLTEKRRADYVIFVTITKNYAQGAISPSVPYSRIGRSRSGIWYSVGYHISGDLKRMGVPNHRDSGTIKKYFHVQLAARFV